MTLGKSSASRSTTPAPAVDVGVRPRLFRDSVPDDARDQRERPAPQRAPVMVANASAVRAASRLLVTVGDLRRAAARDVQSRMHAFYTSRCAGRNYRGGRFLGRLAVNSGGCLGRECRWAPPRLGDAVHGGGKVGPVQPAAYVQAVPASAPPELVVIGAFMFAAAALTRQSLSPRTWAHRAVRLGSFAWPAHAVWTTGRLPALADPVRRPCGRADHAYWTPAESDTRAHRVAGSPAVEPRAVARRRVGVFALLVARFRFEHQAGRPGTAGWRRRRLVDTAPERIVPIARRTWPMPGAPSAPPGACGIRSPWRRTRARGRGHTARFS